MNGDHGSLAGVALDSLRQKIQHLHQWRTGGEQFQGFFLRLHQRGGALALDRFGHQLNVERIRDLRKFLLAYRTEH